MNCRQESGLLITHLLQLKLEFLAIVSTFYLKDHRPRTHTNHVKVRFMKLFKICICG